MIEEMSLEDVRRRVQELVAAATQLRDESDKAREKAVELFVEAQTLALQSGLNFYHHAPAAEALADSLFPDEDEDDWNSSNC